ncbi:MAG: T9SS type A sorting domain-containing protein, partial [Ignavibacterium sp.]
GSDDWGLAIYNENGVTGINFPTNVIDESYIDKKFVLYQNYPNPFNSKTKIKFSIPLSGFTSLKIYDLLGQEIATLVNETKQIGEHEIEFDADKYNLSSGVYIYKLKNNSFVQSKKFILMK